ncbi:MAG: adenylosuccinate lyase [Candidatus Edwardsbacteria bacterium RIFOXYD12_FULL_50_11]|uniref:Adenylosuccinate lyase n=1 Tax=Candidatus Edwardsbacteria bacterium GWF2_54_11 TaxID=1817851 RepID=A0A1F5R0X1_9BACT|nr:MAG: adenylosuccinate lyase [Candidatus Edwardsbacteria bacterium RifOxyC12_full_54_24]OGF08096.1 MAG: adenylosuccinate lyase [Candidatus Edwardsbacteria bacterium GWF2_54_11]OGF08627.1 MAG: adenylosuccinate lyase [Candidatus Edwardsbacteria bacterium RifOxyA12_full_54_48]OGF11271.1 MAG: adenylosuccinate lyase [Candidatus Edwardsbacteria bacterium GWE2_54_12]OGF16787.1 MAG: adenylosuccinate lyase [Candidatus Edwardsbacteria bacterium RIFOXYD12_FULL_50_11]OGJ18085.1 MAG: adenylosuccinate lya
MIERYTLPKMKAVWSEQNKFQKWLDIEILACEAQARLGRIPQKDLENIKARAGFDIARIDQIEAEVQHDVIAFLTSVNQQVGESGRFIHMGLTSSDVLDTAWAVLMKEAGRLLMDDLNKLSAVLKQRAWEHKDTLMMGRSHGIHAEPTTFGLKLAMWWQEIQRDILRMERAIETISCGKISGAVGTFAHIDPSVEEYVCQKLELKPEPVSTQIVQRDRHAEYLCTLGIIASTLDKIALEIRHLQRTEVREAEEPFSEKQKGSSAMPHKRNPIISERICGMARVIRTNALVGMENVALWHERDISHSSAERIVIPDSTIALDYILNKTIWLIEGLRVYPERMALNIESSGGLIFSQKLLLALVEKGISREDAYRIIQRNAMKVWEGGGNLKQLVLADAEVARSLDAKAIADVFDPESFIRNIGHIFKRIGLNGPN